MSRCCAVIALLLMCSAFAVAQNEPPVVARTMEQLVRNCDAKASSNSDATEKLLENTMGTGFCFGFFAAMLDATAIAEVVLEKPLFCLPKAGISLDQAMKVYLKYAKDHPEQLHVSARVTVAAALMQAFPCKK